MSAANELPKVYSPAEIEQAIYEQWLTSTAFHARPDQRPREQRYVVMMPLPNVTGALHMGHAMDNVMQDLLIRWHRMRGDNTLWMPGTDHAGIATQAVVEKRLKELSGITRHDIGRVELVQRIWQWKDQYQARIISQQQRMGCSCDWQRQRFTMDAVCARAVRQAFLAMFRDGLIFRGKRLINWDPYLRTSISDDEIYHETVQGHFWHLRYPILDPRPGEPAAVVVATTRPETMLGDTAVAVHPDPEAALAQHVALLEASLATASEKERPALGAELQALQQRQQEVLPRLIQLRDMAQAGRQVMLPLLDRPLPLICDEWAKPELGSGCVKITPAHDNNDYTVWQRHQETIEIINILEEDGTLNEAAGPYAGLDRFVARERVVADLERLGLLEKIEDREVEIGHSDRSKVPVEPFLSEQWFIKMGDLEAAKGQPGGIVMGRSTDKAHRSVGLVQAAMDAVNDKRVQIHPERYTKTYLDWLAEKRDWPISRQLWWGHRIPVWSKQETWATLGEDWAELARHPWAKKRVIRVQQVESGHSQLLEDPLGELQLPPGSLSGGSAWLRILFGKSAPSSESHSGKDAASESPAGKPADELYRLDVCLLEDDEAQLALLERLGLVQDPDVLDTWFSSSLWPFSTLGWPDPTTAHLDPGQAALGPTPEYPDDCLTYYYPGSCLVTARDIITLWVARMVVMGLYNLGDVPFSDVFIHANILDGKGERMSKSKGNGIDPVDIIETYGTDAMRYVLCDMQTGTQDIRLPVTAVCPHCGQRNDLALTQHGRSIFTYLCGKLEAKGQAPDSCGGEFDVLGTIAELPAATLISERFEVGRAFCTKLWNSARFAFMNLTELPDPATSTLELALEDRWILDSLNQAIGAVNRGLADYNPSAALGAARDFFWGDLCDWYLELIKPRLQHPAKKTDFLASQVLAYCLDQVLRLLHPFVPFITEHLWQRLNTQVPRRGLGDLAPAVPAELLISASWPEVRASLEAPELRATFADLQAMTRAIREVRTAQGLPPRHPLTVTLKPRADRSAALREQVSVMTRLAGVEQLLVDPQAVRQPGWAVKVVGDLQIFVHDVIDDAVEMDRLQHALAKIEKEVTTCERNLANPRFVDRAPPEVVQEQRERLASYQASRDALRTSLAELKVTNPEK